MKVQIDIDEALAEQLEMAARARGVPSRDFIRCALQQAAVAPATTTPCTPFTQVVHDFGTHIETPWTLLAELESEEYVRKYTRK